MSLWNQCLERLRQELPTQQFSMWIRPLVPQEEEGVVALFAPNRFILDWVRDKYLDNITGLLREFAGPNAPQLRLDVMSRESLSRSRAAASSAPQQPQNQNQSHSENQSFSQDQSQAPDQSYNQAPSQSFSQGSGQSSNQYSGRSSGNMAGQAGNDQHSIDKTIVLRDHLYRRVPALPCLKLGTVSKATLRLIMTIDSMIKEELDLTQCDLRLSSLK